MMSCRHISVAAIFGILFLPLFYSPCFAQDSNKLVILSKQIIEANTAQEAYPVFEELKGLYLKENKYNEFVEYLDSLLKQKVTLGPLVNYSIGSARYYQLKHLEETQNWDEYFSRGNAYRDEITQSLQKAIDASGPQDVYNLYARLTLWKFHKDQNDALSDSVSAELMNSALAYARQALDMAPIKEVAGEFSSYGEKAKAKQLYKIYVDKMLSSEIKDEELNTAALGFYKEGNLDLAESLYDCFIERIEKSYPKEKLIPDLIEVAKLFSYKEQGLYDALYAEKLFQKIESLGIKEAFGEELMYLRAFNLEKAKEYPAAKDMYVKLVQSYPQTVHYDEADFKSAIIYTYVLRDIKTGRSYFEKLAQKEPLGPQTISSLYQLGLLSQWEEDLAKAKDYYNKLLERAKDGFPETVALTKERLKEIEEAKTLEYNLKMFLDVSLREDYAAADMTKLDLESYPYRVKKDGSLNISSAAYTSESGCLEVNLQYLWSGHIGQARPSMNESSFDTAYTQTGTKEINLVVVSPTGVIDRNIDIVDVD